MTLSEVPPTPAGVREITDLLSMVHQPNPGDKNRWDIAPGKHREFSVFVAALAAAKGEGE